MIEPPDSVEAFYARFVVPEQVEDERWALRREVSAKIRRLLPALVSRDGSLEQFRAADAEVDKLLEIFGIADPDTPPPFTTSYGDGAYVDAPEWFTDRNPVVGHLSPFAPPLVLHETAEAVTGTVFFSSAYEGPPGNVHGGFVASILDQTLGRAPIAARIPIMTGSLTVNYRRPTPIERELTVASRITGIEGKKVLVSGEICVDGTPTADAEGIFIDMSDKNFRQHLNPETD